MLERAEKWRLRSGTWYRDLKSETWRLGVSPGGTTVNAKLPAQDLGRMIGASRDSASGQWFPSDFNYSPQTGAPLQITISSLDSPWVPPFGTAALSDLARPLASGLKQTATPLSLTRSNAHLHPASDPDRTLPPLPPGEYRFVVHKFDVASPTLMAIEPQRGHLLVLLPESTTWVPLEQAGAALADGPRNSRGWRMEVVKQSGGAILYLPTALGLAELRPTLIGLSYEVGYCGEGMALGGPVAWAGQVWVPVPGQEAGVDLVGKRPGAAQATVLKTSAPVPKGGFEAPVFDARNVIWPAEEGQLVVRLDQNGDKKTDWVAWPAGLRPAFPLGCPYQSVYGFFWQLCWREQRESLEYVEMGKPAPERVAVGSPRLGTGHISYKDAQRIVGDPWKEPQAPQGTSSEIVLPLIESETGGAVIGLRIEAPQGVLAVLESKERQRAVLQLQAESRADVLFGTLDVAMPWLVSVFVYDAHLWVYHPELPQALGWKLFD